jgi:uncharacterized protein
MQGEATMNDINNSIKIVENELIKNKLIQVFSQNIKEGIAIAFSGGVDSSLLLKIACDIGKQTGHPIMAVTFETKLHPHGDLDEAKELAQQFGAIHKIIEVDEFQDPSIMDNPVDRCYRCKKLLFQTLIEAANTEGFYYLVDGSNYDDLQAYRPGMKALKELNIHSPLLDLEITKKQIRSLASELNISSSDRPSAPCLATRLPYGTRFDFDLLTRIDQGEHFIKKYGFYNVRLRLHEDILRLEIDKNDFARLLEHKDIIIEKLKELGFLYITLDLEGFRSGSMDIKIQPLE